MKSYARTETKLAPSNASAVANSHPYPSNNRRCDLAAEPDVQHLQRTQLAIFRTLILFALHFAFAMSAAAGELEPHPDAGKPSVKALLRDLDQLHPIPFERVRRDVSPHAHADRVAVALNFGMLIADGFLNVAVEHGRGVEQVHSALLKHAKSLGVDQEVLSRGKHLQELAAAGRWKALRRELVATEAEIERAMRNLRDEDMAQLVGLGGWLRGFDITSSIIFLRYKPHNTKLLTRPDVLDRYISALADLRPSLRRKPLLRELHNGLLAIRQVIGQQPPLRRSDVDRVRVLASELVFTISHSR
jgi:hypothetical protein